MCNLSRVISYFKCVKVNNAFRGVDARLRTIDWRSRRGRKGGGCQNGDFREGGELAPLPSEGCGSPRLRHQGFHQRSVLVEKVLDPAQAN